MNLEKEMRAYGFDLDSGSAVSIEPAVRIAKQYAEEMCRKQRDICAQESFPMSSSTYTDILNAPLATEEK